MTFSRDTWVLLLAARVAECERCDGCGWLQRRGRRSGRRQLRWFECPGCKVQRLLLTELTGVYAWPEVPDYAKHREEA